MATDAGGSEFVLPASRVQRESEGRVAIYVNGAVAIGLPSLVEDSCGHVQ